VCTDGAIWTLEGIDDDSVSLDFVDVESEFGGNPLALLENLSVG